MSKPGVRLSVATAKFKSPIDMMVDTCVILDILEPDPVFGAASAEALEEHAEDGLITRNADDFRTLFPSLKIVTPKSP